MTLEVSQTDAEVVGEVLLRVYHEKIKPAVVNETHYDRREKLILKVLALFDQPKVRQIIPDIIREIVDELRDLTPTAEQVAASKKTAI